MLYLLDKYDEKLTLPISFQTTMQKLFVTGEKIALCLLLRVAIGCLRSGQSLQYSGLLLINKIIDTCVTQTLPLTPDSSESPSTPLKEEIRADSFTNIFSGSCVQLLLNALNNGITLHKRGVSTRLHCTPSNRSVDFHFFSFLIKQSCSQRKSRRG